MPNTDSAPSTPSLLDVQALTIGYRVRGEIERAVEDVTFTIASGERVALVGESGSGKSTIGQSLLGLLSDNAVLSGGTIKLAGQSLVGIGERTFRRLRGRKIGFIPQDPGLSLNPVLSVGRQLAETLQTTGVPPATARERAVALLDEVGFTRAAHVAGQYPHQLSGGMRQRVLIAIAIANQPRLLVADEPTSALDVTVQRRILDLLHELSVARGLAMLLITHDLAVAAERTDRIIALSSGRIVETNTAERIVLSPQHPYTRSLIAAVPSFRPAHVTPRREVAAADSIPLVEARGLRKSFGAAPHRRRGEPNWAVDGVDLSVQRGRTLALVGESGSGKTTVARLLLRLETLDAGRIRFGGKDVLGLRGRALRAWRRRAQYVHQNPYASLSPARTIADTIEEPLISLGIGDRRARAARVAELIERVALPATYARRFPSELSGGQRQRVAIARALAPNAEFIVLDEAVSALDVTVQAQVLRLLADIQSDLGVSYLFISHDLAVVREIADDVIVLRAGSITEQGPVATVFGAPRHEYTRELLAAIPRPLRSGHPRHDHL